MNPFLATATFSDAVVTLDFANGTTLIFAGNDGWTVAFDSSFGSVVTAGGGADADNTVAFGVASSTIPTFS